MVDCFYWRAAYSYGAQYSICAVLGIKRAMEWCLCDDVAVAVVAADVIVVVALSLSVNNSNGTNSSVERLYYICVLFGTFHRVLSFCYEVALMYHTHSTTTTTAHTLKRMYAL